MVSGSIVAIATPMEPDGALDLGALRRLIDFHVANGTNGIVIVGTTGESPTVDVDEHCMLIRSAVEFAAGRIPVIAGTGGNSTAEAIALTEYAKSAGVQSCLSVVPYYNKPTQEGLYVHFKAVNDAIGIPIFIYNIPPRSVVDMSVETMKRLFELKNIAGVKDATGNLARVSTQREAMGPDFIQLSGEDMTALAYNACGGHGCISVVANVAPGLCAKLQEATLANDYPEAMKIQDRLVPLHAAIFLEPGLAGAKCGLALLGRGNEDVRLPLLPVTPPTKAIIKKAMVHAGLLN
jgi:4-hydroxy-tetrahydrodipicolinate synthase